MSMTFLVNELELLAESWRQLALDIRARDRHSPAANELDNCADDLAGICENYNHPGGDQ